MDFIKQLNLTEGLAQNLAIVGGELLLLIFIYLFISKTTRFLLNRFQSVESLKPYADRFNAFYRVFLFFLRIAFLLLLFSVIGINGYQMYLGTDLKAYTLDWISRIPPGFWKELGINLAKVFGLIIVARYLIKMLDLGLQKIMKQAVEYKQLRSNDKSVTDFFLRLNKIQRTAVWLFVLYVATNLFPFPESIKNASLLALKIYLIISIGILIVSAVAAIVDSLDGLSKKYAETNDLLAFYKQLHHLIPVLRRTLEYIIYAAVATLVLKQLDFIAHLAEYGPGVIQGIGLFFIARVVIEIINMLIDKNFLHDGLAEADRLQNETIFPIIKNILAGLIFFIVIVLILRGLGFDPLPLLAGAGILGMVIGLGAQELVNDVVSGFFIILDNTFRVGDYIAVKDATGRVESIGLRTTRVRSRDGQLFILRNGQLEDIVNYSRNYTNAVVEVGVDHESDLKQVYAVLNRIGETIEQENEDVQEKTIIDGIEDFSGPELIIRTITKVKPGCHEAVEREIRKRIKDAFDEAGISIPFDKRYQLG